MIVRERDAKHGSGQHRHDSALQLDGFFRIHTVAADVSFISNVGPENFSGPTFKTALPAKACELTLPAAAAPLRTRTLFARTRFVNS